MGAFHEGHLSLMRRARQLSDVVVVSLFVNPMQFAKGEDFERYPRDEAADFALAEDVGVDVIFAPSQGEMYPSTTTTVHVCGVADLWEGVSRPGHFDGVATVVAKLFNIVKPNVAVFGLKDYQQCAVIAQMIRNLNFPLRLELCETVREVDGLALSSRNRYLSAEQRATAPMLYQVLSAFIGLGCEVNQLDGLLQDARNRLQVRGFEVDYVEVVDSETMFPSRVPDASKRVVAAVKLGTTRLIDNVQL
jgi:pantoate--beta-alanine ligase